MMAANHCLISIGVKKQSESQHCFAQIWRLASWQFLRSYCPWRSNTRSLFRSDRVERVVVDPCSFELRILAFTSSTSGLPSPLRPGGGLVVHQMTQHNGAMEFHNCSSKSSGVEPQGSGWSFWGASMQNPNLDAQSQWWVAIFLVDDVFIAFPCYSFCSTERSRVWLLLSCLREPDCSPDSICFCKLLSCPA